MTQELKELPALGRRLAVGRGAVTGVLKLACTAALLLAYPLVVPRGDARSISADTGDPEFEVVSVRLSGTVGLRLQTGNGPGRIARGFRYSPRRLTCDLPLSALVDEAFSLQPWQVSGPSWLSTDTYDLAATMSADTTKETARLMLRAMLVERFGLKFHREQKQFSVYGLVARKGRLKMLEVVPDPGRYRQTMGAGRFSATAIRMEKFAEWLSNIAGRPVIDMTGIKGVYKIDMVWTPAYEAERFDAGIFDAVNQLGLKLESRKAQLELLVIDHVERTPAAN